MQKNCFLESQEKVIDIQKQINALCVDLGFCSPIFIDEGKKVEFTCCEAGFIKIVSWLYIQVFESGNNRLNFIEHKAIRKSHLLQDHFKGKTEFEKQLRKNHKSNETTKIYYEDQNIEWKGIKKHKIAIAQNLIVGIFKGEIGENEHKTAKLFYGPFADCKDNRKPSFTNAAQLKNDEHCQQQSYFIPW